MTAHGPKIVKTTNQTVPKVHILHTSSLHNQKVTTVLYFVKLPTWSVSKNVGRRALPTRVACTTNDIQSYTISEPRVTELNLFYLVDGGFLLTCASCSRPISSRACRDLEDHTFKSQHLSSCIKHSRSCFYVILLLSSSNSFIL